jgi:hypothetical protein
MSSMQASYVGIVAQYVRQPLGNGRGRLGNKHWTVLNPSELLETQNVSVFLQAIYRHNLKTSSMKIISCMSHSASQIENRLQSETFY